MKSSTRVLKRGEFDYQHSRFLPEKLARLPLAVIAVAAETCEEGPAPELVPGPAGEEPEESVKERLEQEIRSRLEPEVRQALEEEIREQAHLGRQQGFEAGFQAGKEAAAAELEGLLAEARRLLTTVLEKREEIIAASELGLVDLAFKIAEKVIDKEVSADRSIIMRTVRKVLQDVDQRDGLVLRLCPQDVSGLTQANLLDLGLSNVKIIEDGRLKPGGCVVDSRFGRADASIEAQLTTIARGLKAVADG